MIKRKVIAPKCMYDNGSGLVELEIGTIVETENANLFGSKAVTVFEKSELEVATPESGSDLEAELRQFIYDKTGQHAGGNTKIATLKRRAEKLGYVNDK